MVAHLGCNSRCFYKNNQIKWLNVRIKISIFRGNKRYYGKKKTIRLCKEELCVK